MTLIEFLTARYNETERAAKWASISGGDWALLTRTTVLVSEQVAMQTGERAAEHVALHDPAAVLADVASKRAILAECWGIFDRFDPPVDDFRAERLAELTLHLLAAPFKSHPDFDPTWETT